MFFSQMGHLMPITYLLPTFHLQFYNLLTYSPTHLPLEENWVFVTNQFATSCNYLTFATIVGYIYNYFLHLVLLATTL